jgi:hypothetical protein
MIFKNLIYIFCQVNGDELNGQFSPDRSGDLLFLAGKKSPPNPIIT